MSNTSNITYNNASGATSLVLAELISANVGEAFRDQAVLLQTCDIMDISAQPTTAASFPYLNVNLTASALSNEYDATSNTVMDFADSVATATERTVSVEIGDFVAQSSVADLVSFATREITGELLASAETSVGAILAGFTAASQAVGTSAAVLSWANMTSAFTNLRINAKQYAGNAGFALYPTQIRDLLNEPISASLGLGRGFSQNELVQFFGQVPGTGILRANVGTFMGCPVLSSDSVPVASSVNSAGALYVWGPGGAIGVAMKWAPKIAISRSDVNGRMATHILGSIAMGAIEKRDKLGVTIETIRA